ncbi:MAG TPA: hypothetical protein DCE80_09485 [Ignavibacteriales bacterium]|nr:hypothetical protein [Ignavibacteriales bacterium]
MSLKKNHRFKDNPVLLNLDLIIRKNAKNIRNDINDVIDEQVIIELSQGKNQNEEANKIIEKIRELKNKEIAILVRQRSQNTEEIIKTLEINKIQFFYALYSEEDQIYLDFHSSVLEIFMELRNSKQYGSYNAITAQLIKVILEKYNDQIEKDRSINSLIELMRVFLQSLKKELTTFDDRLETIIDTLKNNALRQYLKDINSNLILTTIHGAKGLEWDYIILPDLESFSNTFLCGLCSKNRQLNCQVELVDFKNPSFKEKFLEELSLFYVAVTRSKKQVFFTYSQETYINNYGTYSLEPCNPCCFLKLDKINLKLS